jgi:hypothetical protein
MADSDYIINRINDSIIADSDAPKIVKALPFSATVWTWFGA